MTSADWKVCPDLNPVCAENYERLTERMEQLARVIAYLGERVAVPISEDVQDTIEWATGYGRHVVDDGPGRVCWCGTGLPCAAHSAYSERAAAYFDGLRDANEDDEETKKLLSDLLDRSQERLRKLRGENG